MARAVMKHLEQDELKVRRELCGLERSQRFPVLDAQERQWRETLMMYFSVPFSLILKAVRDQQSTVQERFSRTICAEHLYIIILLNELDHRPRQLAGS